MQQLGPRWMDLGSPWVEGFSCVQTNEANANVFFCQNLLKFQLMERNLLDSIKIDMGPCRFLSYIGHSRWDGYDSVWQRPPFVDAASHYSWRATYFLHGIQWNKYVNCTWVWKNIKWLVVLKMWFLFVLLFDSFCHPFFFESCRQSLVGV